MAAKSAFSWPNYLKIVFRTDASVLGKGFEAEFVVDEPDACSSCPDFANTSIVGSDSVYQVGRLSCFKKLFMMSLGSSLSVCARTCVPVCHTVVSAVMIRHICRRERRGAVGSEFQRE